MPETYRIKLFAAARALMGAEELALEIPGEASVGAIRAQLHAMQPRLGELLRRSSFAVDNRYVNDAYVVRPENEIACIPPVSGG